MYIIRVWSEADEPTHFGPFATWEEATDVTRPMRALIEVETGDNDTRVWINIEELLPPSELLKTCDNCLRVYSDNFA